jgi:hypothetical protein
MEVQRALHACTSYSSETESHTHVHLKLLLPPPSLLLPPKGMRVITERGANMRT